MGNTSALNLCFDMVDSVVLLSSVRALLIPKCAQSRWEVCLTEAHHRSPADCITKVCWRASRYSGRTWAKPLVLDSAVRVARTRARAGNGLPLSGADPQSLALLILRGPAGSDPDGLLKALMKALESKVGFPLQQGNPSLTLQRHHWLQVRDGRDVWTGNVAIQLASTEEVGELMRIVHGSVVEVDGERRPLELQNAFASDVSTPNASPPGQQNQQQSRGKRAEKGHGARHGGASSLQ